MLQYFTKINATMNKGADSMKQIKVMSIFGTRPEAIKLAPLIKELEKSEHIHSLVCVTAQHREMLDQVLDIFDITPDYDLNIMKQQQTLLSITTKALSGISEVLEKEKPDLILVHGDTSTTFCGALAGFYQKICVGHVEAGLRTFNKYEPFPEEVNRCLTSVLTNLHFAPTMLSKTHLLQENVSPNQIFVTGNTVIDALSHTIEQDFFFSEPILNQIDFKHHKIISMTAHRRENLGKPLEQICQAVKQLVKDFPDVEVVYPMHKNPKVLETVHEILGHTERVHLIEPLDLKDMHNLMSRSYFVLTDSGGLQEEVPSMGKPVLVLRNVTERPEGISAGTLKLVGTETNSIYENCKALLENDIAYAQMAQAKNPFGDGFASQRIVHAILYHFGKTSQKVSEYLLSDSSEPTTPKHQNQSKPIRRYNMKDERMTILNLLEKGAISASEASDLLRALNASNPSPLGEKMTDVLGTVARKTGDTIETMQPIVKDMAEKLYDKVDDAKPLFREKAQKMSSAFSDWREKSQMKANDTKPEEFHESEFNFDETDSSTVVASDVDFADTNLPVADESDFDTNIQVVTLTSISKESAPIEIKEEVKEEVIKEDNDIIDIEIIDQANVLESSQPAEEDVQEEEPAKQEEESDAIDNLDENMSSVLDTLQSQLNELQDAESFLKNTFGTIEFDDEELEADKKENAEDTKDEE